MLKLIRIKRLPRLIANLDLTARSKAVTFNPNLLVFRVVPTNLFPGPVPPPADLRVVLHSQLRPFDLGATIRIQADLPVHIECGIAVHHNILRVGDAADWLGGTPTHTAANHTRLYIDCYMLHYEWGHIWICSCSTPEYKHIWRGGGELEGYGQDWDLRQVSTRD